MRKTIEKLLLLTEEAGDKRCVLNFVVSDGTQVVATRCAHGMPHASLYYTSGTGWEKEDSSQVCIINQLINQLTLPLI